MKSLMELIEHFQQQTQRILPFRRSRDRHNKTPRHIRSGYTKNNSRGESKRRRLMARRSRRINRRKSRAQNQRRRC